MMYCPQCGIEVDHIEHFEHLHFEVQLLYCRNCNTRTQVYPPDKLTELDWELIEGDQFEYVTKEDIRVPRRIVLECLRRLAE